MCCYNFWSTKWILKCNYISWRWIFNCTQQKNTKKHNYHTKTICIQIMRPKEIFTKKSSWHFLLRGHVNITWYAKLGFWDPPLYNTVLSNIKIFCSRPPYILEYEKKIPELFQSIRITFLFPNIFFWIILIPVNFFSKK